MDKKIKLIDLSNAFIGDIYESYCDDSLFISYQESNKRICMYYDNEEKIHITEIQKYSEVTETYSILKREERHLGISVFLDEIILRIQDDKSKLIVGKIYKENKQNSNIELNHEFNVLNLINAFKEKKLYYKIEKENMFNLIKPFADGYSKYMVQETYSKDNILTDSYKIKMETAVKHIAYQKDNVKDLRIIERNTNPIDFEVMESEEIKSKKIEQDKKEFFNCINTKNVDNLKSLLNNGIDINIMGKDNNTPLIEASKIGSEEIVKELIKLGANLDLQTTCGDTALMKASEKGYVEIVTALVNAGADVNKRANNKQSSLICATRKGYVNIVKVLVESGANLDTIDYSNNNALCYAAENNYIDIVKVLVESKVDLNVKGEYGTTPLTKAVERGNIEIVRYLIENGSDLNKNYRYSVLSCTNNFEIIKLLVESGANLNDTNKDYETPLMKASKNNELETAKLLIECGADLNSKDNYYFQTALIYACERGYLEIAKLLVQAGADLDIIDYPKYTALTYACKNGHIEIVKLLMAAGAGINLLQKGKSSLIVASEKGHLEIVKLLVEAEADLDIQDYSGYSALMYASENGHLEVAKLLIKSGADLDIQSENLIFLGEDGDSERIIESTALIKATKKGYTEIVKLLIEGGADVDIQDQFGKTALWYGCRYNHLEIVKLLLFRNANFNIKDKDGKTVLDVVKGNKNSLIDDILIEFQSVQELKKKEKKEIALACAKYNNYSHYITRTINDCSIENLFIYACRKGYPEIVKDLINDENEINVKDINRMTALMHASVEGHVEIVKSLIGARANLNFRDNKGMTALIHAIKNNNLKIVKLLLESNAKANIKDENGNTGLIHAIRNDCIEIVKLLIATPIHAETEIRIALEEAVYKGNIEEVKLITKFEIEIYYVIKNINLSISLGHKDVAKFLLKINSNLSMEDKEMMLMNAAEYGNIDIIKILLIDCDIDLNRSDRTGYTVLIHACENGYLEIVNFLIEKGVDINIFSKSKGIYGSSKNALLSACMKGHVEIVKSLISAGADIKLQDKNGKDALLYAQEKGHKEIEKILSNTK